MSAIETATKVETTASEAINDLVYEAMLSYEQALKSGIQLQEDSVKVWKDLLAKSGSAEALQAQLGSLSKDVFPDARKHLQEFLEGVSLGLMLVNRAGSQTLDLLEKSLEICQAASLDEVRFRITNLVETSLAARRKNAHAILNTNLKIIHSWTDLTIWSPLKGACAVAQAMVEAPRRPS